MPLSVRYVRRLLTSKLPWGGCGGALRHAQVCDYDEELRFKCEGCQEGEKALILTDVEDITGTGGKKGG